LKEDPLRHQGYGLEADRSRRSEKKKGEKTMKNRLTQLGLVALATAILTVLVMGFWRPVAAQQTAQQDTLVFTRTGFAVEEVLVGQSCVVVVSRGLSGPQAAISLAAVPCR
jgi:hypothetical protein